MDPCNIPKTDGPTSYQAIPLRQYFHGQYLSQRCSGFIMSAECYTDFLSQTIYGYETVGLINSGFQNP
jgi:hypothetical protein